jgi:signal recognition particle subunit SRP54
VGKPIKFISTGEKLDALESFYPDRMASRILGMGDVLTLVEKAQESIDEKEAEKVAKQMMSGEFTLDMFVNTQRMMKKMGSFGDVMKMMGVGGMFGINSDQQDQIANHGETMFKRYETAINSMTAIERSKPEKIDMSRRRRIARGSGLKENEVGQMLKEFEQMRAMFAQFHKMLGGLPLAGLAGGLGGALDGGGLGKAFDPARLAGKMPLGRPAKPAPPKGFPFAGPGGGYYRKKKKHQ